MSQFAAAAAASNPESQVDPPKDDPISRTDLAKYDGSDSSGKIYVAVKGYVFDVTKNPSDYGPKGRYNVFAGKDASRGLATSSLKAEDLTPLSPGEQLDGQHQKVLDDWFEFFKKRYNIVGKLVE